VEQINALPKFVTCVTSVK